MYKVLPAWREGQQLVKYPRDLGIADLCLVRTTGSAQSGNSEFAHHLWVGEGTFHQRVPGMETRGGFCSAQFLHSGGLRIGFVWGRSSRIVSASSVKARLSRRWCGKNRSLFKLSITEHYLRGKAVQ